jgi:hypothetical protein
MPQHCTRHSAEFKAKVAMATSGNVEKTDQRELLMIDRCHLCGTILDRKSSLVTICNVCGLLQGNDWEMVERNMLSVQSRVLFPNYSCLQYRLRLQKAYGNKSWGEFGFTPRSFEILLNKFGYTVTKYQYTKNLYGLWSLYWRYRANIVFHVVHSSKILDAEKRGIALGIICKADDCEPVANICDVVMGKLTELVVVIDSNDESRSLEFRNKLILLLKVPPVYPIVVSNRVLENDFSAQRNHLQTLSRQPWVLHLDTDEMPSEDLLENLDWLVKDCENKSRTVVGIPRKNYVDGQLTAAYPDFQNRLLRSTVPWVGRVHETPLPCKTNYKQTTLFLGGHIYHNIASERLAVRKKMYESIKSGGGATESQSLLEQPFRLQPSNLS